ncbi:MAG: hypothetical protein B7C24_16540 [Bacteroidetes bacterium 4572_77]|nr:MAG: hypothetical protein B7C24_16540 [Bacteroidetes bacterium 4572_77]
MRELNSKDSQSFFSFIIQQKLLSTQSKKKYNFEIQKLLNMRRIKSQGLLVLFIAFLSVNITQAQFVSDTMSLQKAHNIFSIKLDNSTYESLNLSLFLQFPEEVVYDDQEFISLQIKNSDASSDLKKLEFARVYLPSLCHEEMPSNELIYNFPMELWQKYLVEAGEVSLVLSGEPQGLKAWISLDYEKGKALSNVKQIIPLWQYDDSANSDYYLEKSINWPSDTYLSYIQIITSGRHQDDFDRKNAAHFYFLKLNGEELAKREVWRDDCGFNPIFPQGKDWYEPRANWCPGLKVNSFVHIIPAHFYKNDSLKFQMEFQKKKVEDSGIDYFITSAVLFILEKPTYKLNASLQEIISK